MTEPASLPLLEKLAAAWPVENWRNVTVLVAISGGPDSVALARGLHKIRPGGEGRLVLAHHNHKLRGVESDADQAFVERLASQLAAEILVGSAPPLPFSPSPALPLAPPPSEESLRDLRYQFLASAANQCGARYVATAHTANDQIETVLFHIIRGTGLAGLAGIPRVRPLTEAATLIRPLLDVSRAQVLDYLQQLDQPYRVDATNAGTEYSRNRIRNQLLPLLERDHNPHVREALARLSQIAAEADDLVDTKARRLLSRIKRIYGKDVEIDTYGLRRASDLVARTALILVWKWQGWPLADMNFNRWEELLAFARDSTVASGTQVAPRMFPGGVRAQRSGDILKLSRTK